MSKNFPSVSISNSALLYAEQLLKRGESLDSERDRTDTDGSSSEESDKKSNSREFSSDVKKFRTTSDSPPSKSPRKSNANYKTSKSCLKSENRIVTDERQLKFSSTDELKPLMGNLYYKAEDYVTFKHEAVHELRIYLTAMNVTAKEAIFQLYQPHYIERKLWMEEFEISQKSDSENEKDTISLSSNISNKTSDEELDSDEDQERTYDGYKSGLKLFIPRKDEDLSRPINMMSKNTRTKIPIRNSSKIPVSSQWGVSWKPKPFFQ